VDFKNISTITSASAKAVVSNATPRPAITSGIDCSRASGVRFAIATVMPTTVPKKPRIGIAQMMIRTKA
jgi:hypothetical protein